MQTLISRLSTYLKYIPSRQYLELHHKKVDQEIPSRKKGHSWVEINFMVNCPFEWCFILIVNMCSKFEVVIFDSF